MTTSWSEHKKEKGYAALDRDLLADVVIIGGGITGVLNAYVLAASGKKVVLLEKDELGSYATLATTAFITEVIDSDLSQIASIFDPETARLVWQSGKEAIDELGRIIEREKIECEFVRCPNYVYARDTEQLQALEKEYEAYKHFNLSATIHTEGAHLGFSNAGYLEIPNQAKFHPAKFLYALAEKAQGYGALIFEHTEAVEIEGEGPIIVSTGSGKVTASDVLIATYKPLSNEQTHLKKAMYRSYVFEVQVPKNMFPEGLYEDTENPYHYFRIDRGSEYDRMIVGGEDHKDMFGDTLTQKSFEALEKFLDTLMDDRRYWILKKWHGPILEPSDGLPLIGRVAPHRFVTTGFSGNGMTYATISALLIKDLISGTKHPWEKVYDPTRTLLHPKRLGSKARDYLEEFWNGAVKNLLS